MLTSLLNGLLSVRGWEAYLIPAALCFGEAAVFLGFFIPGEVAVVYGGVLASRGHVSVELMALIVVGAAIAGDTTGYLIGRFFGEVLLRRRPLRGNRGVERTRDFLNRRGGIAVFLGRFVSVFRALMPGMAGASELAFPVFLFYNALGGIIWGIAFTLVGYLAGQSYGAVLKVIGSATTGVLIAVVVAIVAFLVVRRLRERRQPDAERDEPKSD